jgi:hypothetical protein
LRVVKQIRSLSDLFLFGRIFVFAAATPRLMRLKLPRLEPWLTPQCVAPPVDEARVQQIIAYTDGAMQLGKPLIQVKCLTRGLTLYYFLSRAGLAVSLCFGVETDKERFAAHCWLVKEGAPFAEPQDPYASYTPVYTLPRRAGGI